MLKFSAIETLLNNLNSQKNASRMSKIVNAINISPKDMDVEIMVLWEEMLEIEKMLEEARNRTDDGETAYLPEDEKNIILETAQEYFTDRYNEYMESDPDVVEYLFQVGIDLKSWSQFAGAFQTLISSSVEEPENDMHEGSMFLINIQSVDDLLFTYFTLDVPNRYKNKEDQTTPKGPEWNASEKINEFTNSMRTTMDLKDPEHPIKVENSTKTVIMKFFEISGLELDEDYDDPEKEKMIKRQRIESLCRMIGIEEIGLQSPEASNMRSVGNEIYRLSQELGVILERNDEKDENNQLNVAKYSEFIIILNNLINGQGLHGEFIGETPIIKKSFGDNLVSLDIFKNHQEEILKNNYVKAMVETRKILDSLIDINKILNEGMNQAETLIEEKIEKSSYKSDKKRFINTIAIPGRDLFERVSILADAENGKLSTFIPATNEDPERWYNPDNTKRSHYIGPAKTIFNKIIEYLTLLTTQENWDLAMDESKSKTEVIINDVVIDLLEIIKRVNSYQGQSVDIFIKTMPEIKKTMSPLFRRKGPFSIMIPYGQVGIPKSLFLEKGIISKFSQSVWHLFEKYEEISEVFNNNEVSSDLEKEILRLFNYFLNLAESCFSPITESIYRNTELSEDELENELDFRRKFSIDSNFKDILDLINQVREIVPTYIQEPDQVDQQPEPVMAKKEEEIKTEDSKPFNLISYKINKFNLRSKRNANR